MSQYIAPVKDMLFVLNNLIDKEPFNQHETFAEITPDLVEAILEEAARFANGELAPLNATGDREGCHFSEGVVTTPAGWQQAYRHYCENGWVGVALPESIGGQHLPKYLYSAINEMWLSANLAFILFQALTQGSADILLAKASREIQQKYLPKLVSGEWSCCMSLTESQAGSDLGQVRARAILHSDGSYRLVGQKIFITYGEHDLTDNILHLVLARIDGAPLGSKGLSLFIVPKILVNDDGSLGEPNEVLCTGIEHKTGLHGSPTCSISYGDKDGAVAELIGEANKGLEAMFILMNEARLSTGMQGVAIGELAYQRAFEYSHERLQGRTDHSKGAPVPIIQHPDVQRMILNLRSQTFALRALGYVIAARLDMSAVDSGKQRKHLGFVSLMTPIFKAFSTETGHRLAGTAIQVFGGMGFVEETEIAQLMRDSRVTTIYEGTTGIQANDLVFRKLVADKGEACRHWLNEVGVVAEQLGSLSRFAEEALALRYGIERAEQALASICEVDHLDVAALQSGAVSFLELLGTLASSWQMACVLITTDRYLAEGEDVEYHQNLVALARHYFAHHTPTIESFYQTFRQADNGIKAYVFDR